MIITSVVTDRRRRRKGSSGKETWTPVKSRRVSACPEEIGVKYVDEARWHDNGGQLVYCEAMAQWTIGDCRLIDKMQEGTIVSSEKEKAAICGSLARTSDTSCMIVGHFDDERTTRVNSL